MTYALYFFFLAVLVLHHTKRLYSCLVLLELLIISSHLSFIFFSVA